MCSAGFRFKNWLLGFLKVAQVFIGGGRKWTPSESQARGVPCCPVCSWWATARCRELDQVGLGLTQRGFPFVSQTSLAMPRSALALGMSGMCSPPPPPHLASSLSHVGSKRLGVDCAQCAGQGSWVAESGSAVDRPLRRACPCEAGSCLTPHPHPGPVLGCPFPSELPAEQVSLARTMVAWGQGSL